MTYVLHIGNKRYSSWSMRPWVLLKALDIPFEEQLHYFQTAERQEAFLKFSPTAKVPCLVDSSNGSLTIWDSLAICEYIAETHPKAWPSDATARAFARCAAAEMHSGFSTIREECSFNVGLRIELKQPSPALTREIERLNELFDEGITRFGGPWLTGKDFTIADAMFAPIASRFKTYGIVLKGKEAQDYAERLFNHSAVREWVRAGQREKEREANHERDSLFNGRRVLEDLTR